MYQRQIIVSAAVLFASATFILSSDQKVKLQNCPAAVQKAFTEKAAGGKIGKVEKAEEGKSTVYEAEVEMKDGKHLEIVVTPEGKLVATELKVELTACPPAVQKTISEKSAGGKVKGVEQVTAANGNVSYTAEIQPAKGDVMDLEVTPKGKVVKFEVDKD